MRAASIPREQRVALAKAASVAAVAALKQKVDPYKQKYGEAFQQLLHLGATVKQRCTNPNNLAYINYGGRGIRFEFPSTRSFAEWVSDNIGCKPSAIHSIDRIDNSGHYAPGNLRWATPSEQARNKRAYKRTKNGERIREIKALRPDLSYETIRLWLTQNSTNEEIINRKKYARSSV